MLFRQSADSCFSPGITPAVSRKEVDAQLEKLKPALAEFKKGGGLAGALLSVPKQTQDLDAIDALAAELRKNYSHVIIAGAGGSGLSGRTLTSLNLAAFSGMLFLENIDPAIIDATLHHCKTGNPCFIIISKSGGTVETLAHFHVLMEWTRRNLGEKNFAQRFTIITMTDGNLLHKTALDFGMRVLSHAPDIGGRFSILTHVGLLPAAIAGLDIRALRKGASTIVESLEKASHPRECEAAEGAALQYAFLQKGCTMSVMLPYSDQLFAFSGWYRQAWAESLGKDGKGSTPIRAIGTTDQHSQLQLYLDGPKDKLFHLILLPRAGTGQPLGNFSHPELSYLQGKTTGDIMEAQQKATLATLTRNGCPVRLFTLDAIREEQMGALLMHFMLEILFMSHLLDVNAFDQPAVEESKQLTRHYLGGAA